MTRNVVLGSALLVLGTAGVAVGLWRHAAGRSAGRWALAAAAAVVGAALCTLALRIGRRGGERLRWLIGPGLVGALFLDRLPSRWQLALLAAAAGYILAFVAHVAARAMRLTRS